LLGLLAGFVLCQAGLTVALEAWLTAVRDPEYAERLAGLRQCRAEAPGRPLVLALGSSRTAFGLDARRLSAGGEGPPRLVYNFGLMGGGPMLSLVTLRRLLADGVRPDLLCLDFVPNTYLDRGSRLMEERLVDGARYRAGEVRLLYGYYHEPRRLLGAWGAGRALPCSRHQAELRNLLLGLPRPHAEPPDPPTVDSHGWQELWERPSAALARASRRVVLEEAERFRPCTRLADGPVRALEDLLTLCRREGIAVTLVRLPESREYRELCGSAARAAVAGLLERVRARWGVGLIDAQQWVPDEEFWDPHHLLSAGARRFSERFGREVLSPALARLARGSYARAVSK
jgi:hypothetical protein